jgi:cobaltochelatase CobN
MIGSASSSWSGLSRPSTFLLVESGVQDVDARHKAEHDGVRLVAAEAVL